jgi:hypothetical protein
LWGTLLAQVLGKQLSFWLHCNTQAQVILFVTFVLYISLHLSGLSLGKISFTVGMSA